MSEGPLDDDLANFEATLRKLAPARGGLSRDQILFRAGQASARRRALLSGALGLGLGLTVALAISFTLGRKPIAPPEVEYVKSPAPGSKEEQKVIVHVDMGDEWRAQMQYLQLQEELSDRGLEALPWPPQVDSPKPLSLDQLLGAS